ncbi:hypothetical protein EDB89DRAFT_1209527 [Lactarius sanguifluus]|nr:hypothetical protein EDB89DRAFT_1209527 [Lactarius sanguifluus]
MGRKLLAMRVMRASARCRRRIFLWWGSSGIGWHTRNVYVASLQSLRFGLPCIQRWSDMGTLSCSTMAGYEADRGQATTGPYTTLCRELDVSGSLSSRPHLYDASSCAGAGSGKEVASSSSKPQLVSTPTPIRLLTPPPLLLLRPRDNSRGIGWTPRLSCPCGRPLKRGLRPCDLFEDESGEAQGWGKTGDEMCEVQGVWARQ